MKLSCALLLGLAFACQLFAEDKDEFLLRHASELQTAYQKLNQPLPKELTDAIQKQSVNSIAALLEKQSLFVVSINPEGRVKLNRGSADPLLTVNRTHYFLVQVNNQSGAQQRLTVKGTYSGAKKNPFTLGFKSVATISDDLSGHSVEYRIMAITANATGKHELSVAIEAGQGTQELGFRGEAPVLFTVEAKHEP